MADSIRVSLLDALEEYDPNINSKKILKTWLLILCIIYIGCSFLLINFSNNKIQWQLNKHFFYNNSFDCFILSILVSFILPLIAYIAIQYGKYPIEVIENEPVNTCSCFKCCYNLTPNNGYNPLHDNIDTNDIDRKTFDSHNEMGQPLLSSIIDNNNKIEILEGYEDEISRTNNDTRNVDEKYLNIRKDLDYKKAVWFGILFVFSTIFQVYLGLKCISFNYTNETKEGIFMGVGVLWINMIVWTLRELVMKETKEDGELIPSLHPHKLHLLLSLGSHWCDLCGQPCKEGRAFRCKLCDFDLCTICYAKKDKFTLEGQLRGDKGIRKEDNLSNNKYFWRAIALAKTEWKIFSVAMASLLSFNSINLWTPMIQGNILNSVVQDNSNKFNYWVKVYLFVSIGAGLLGGIQSLCFNVVGRKLTNTVRIKLFKGIIVQDVAFFDGNSSGQLTSRLTNDISFMISPIQSMLGTLVSNIILLFGGIILCFMTSWRLSMLAFTTIGPIIHITQVYASWSQTLNRRIYGALAAANGYATEALGNIRTVKSFCTESQEQDKYNKAINNALLKGIKDAFGGAGMYAMNSYLELGAAVLILWYGGKMAMSHKDDMSPDIITSFTRAGGAAQRVFSLMDSLPDIDIDAGIKLKDDQLIGHLEIHDVDFAYQMRPDAMVLNKVSINIPAGTTCALVGKSGGGKSTIVNLLMRFYDPISGSICLDNTNIKDLCLRDIRKQIGIVQQNTELFGGTIEDNITYGMEEGTWTRSDVIEAAKNACAHEFIKKFPEGYMTRVGERGIRISGGQKQRISIARVFLRKPKLLFLDEATSALDAESEGKVQEALDKLMNSDYKRTVVLVAHRLSTVMNADQIIVINEGKISERGKHDELINLNGQYANLVKRQLAKKNNTVDSDAIDPILSDFDSLK